MVLSKLMETIKINQWNHNQKLHSMESHSIKFNQNHSMKINHSMWNIYGKNKGNNNKCGIGSRLNACKALLIFAKYYGTTEYLKTLGDTLRPLLTNNRNICCSYLILLQSIFTDYIGLQIKLNNTDSFDKWLRDFILFMIDLIVEPKYFN
eukprot:168351_1